MNASEIAKIEDTRERINQFGWFCLGFRLPRPARRVLSILAWDIINQQVTKNTIVLANDLWKEYGNAIEDMPYIELPSGMSYIELPDIVKLIANHNPDFQPGEEAFVLLDDMVKVEE